MGDEKPLLPPGHTFALICTIHHMFSALHNLHRILLEVPVQLKQRNVNNKLLTAARQL